MARRRWRRFAAVALSVPAVLVGGGLAVGGCVLSAPRYQGPPSAHFDGERFLNQGNVTEAGTADLLRWLLGGAPKGPWAQVQDAPSGPRPPYRVPAGTLRVTFVNHATVLLQLDGVNVLTDPIWSQRASPFSFAGPARFRPPGLRFEDLPPIDAVVLSHNHYDHFDAPTLVRLSKQFPRARFFAGLGNLAMLRKLGIDRAEELDWWDSRELGEVKLTAVPVQHFSGRGLCDRNGTLWAGWVLQGKTGGNAYFAGDTGFGPHFAQVGERFAPLRLAVLPIGAYKPEWFMKPIHVSPAEAVEAAKALRAKVNVPMHYGTFNLADDGQDEPLQALTEATKAPGSPVFWPLGFGEGRDVP